MIDAIELQQGLSQFNDFSGTFYVHPIYRFYCSEGINYLYQNGGGWLIDLIGNHQAQEVRDVYGLNDFQVWILRFVEDEGQLRCYDAEPKDDDEKPRLAIDLFALDLMNQGQASIEFPLNEFTTYVVDSSIVLPSEYLGEQQQEDKDYIQISMADNELAERTLLYASIILNRLNTNAVADPYCAISIDSHIITVFEPYTKEIWLKGSVSNNNLLISNIEMMRALDIEDNSYALDMGGKTSFIATGILYSPEPCKRPCIGPCE